MARTSPVLLLKWRRPVNPRQEVWKILREEKSISFADLCSRLKIHTRTIQDYLRGLQAAGILSFDGEPGLRRATLIRDTGIRAPRIRKDGSPVEMGQGRQAAWTGIRIQKRFTVRDLHLTTGIDEGDAKSFCKYLVKAGYLRVAEKGGPGKLTTYLLDPRRDSGPLAPQVTRLKMVFDPNTNEVSWPNENSDVEAQVEGAIP